jgi:uncharacterized protein YajQ (UPF0234 family)
MPSFDVISKVNYQEFDNALANCLREISNRYDFKGLNISIERKDKTITTIATDELKLKQVNELLETHLIRRKVDPRVLSVKNSEGASGGTIQMTLEIIIILLTIVLAVYFLFRPTSKKEKDRFEDKDNWRGGF